MMSIPAKTVDILIYLQVTENVPACLALPLSRAGRLMC